MYKFFIGCDMSKDTFDVAYYDQEPIYLGKFRNNCEGYSSMVKRLAALSKIPCDQWFVGFENTGVYSRNFLYFLLDNQISCIEENAVKIKYSAPLKRGKTDPLDAKMICMYVKKNVEYLTPSKQTHATISKIRILFSKREFYMKQKKALTTSRKETKIILSDDLLALWDPYEEEMEKAYNEKIKQLDNLIQYYISNEEAIKKNYELIESIVGIGTITATYLIAVTENFQQEYTARKLAAHAGIAPFPNQSGKQKGTMSTKPQGNRTLKKVISNCVASAIMHDPYFRRYHDRLLAKNKPKGIIYNNIKNKLFGRVFAVIERQSPYVKLAYQ